MAEMMIRCSDETPQEHANDDEKGVRITVVGEDPVAESGHKVTLMWVGNKTAHVSPWKNLVLLNWKVEGNSACLIQFLCLRASKCRADDMGKILWLRVAPIGASHSS